MARSITPEERKKYMAILEKHKPYTPDDPEYNMFDGQQDPMRGFATLVKDMLEKHPEE